MNDPGQAPAPADVATIGGYIRLSPQLARELTEQRIGPLHGPAEPDALRLRRDLRGHAAGPYRTVRTRP